MPRRNRRKRRRAPYPIWLKYLVVSLALAIVLSLAQIALHAYRADPRDARTFAERELRLTLLRPNERVLASVSVWQRPLIDYFRATRMFPPQHLIVLRREAWEQNKWIARTLTEAFVRCTDEYAKAQRSFPYASPWLDAELEETEALMGADFHADGCQRNKATIEVFAEQAHLAGIVGRRISAEEYFAEYLEG